MIDKELSFWEHLEALRSVLVKSVIAWLVASLVAFFLKEPLFRLLFAPLGPDQNLINIDVISPFMTHIQVSLCFGFVVALPLMIAWLYNFVAPAISSSGKKQSISFVCAAFLLFLSGVVLNYFVIFPFSFRFLSTYPLSDVVLNHISLQSYMSLMLVLSIMMGLFFEVPVATWLLAHLGVLRREHLKRYRKYVFVAVLVIAALITPTGDPYTLLLVTLPVYLLYELSIWIIQ